MNTNNPPLNPFQAPESAAAESRLADDTQFLVSEDFILSDAEVRLPAVCIFTGAQTGLQECRVRTAWYPRWIQFMKVISVFVLLMSIPAALRVVESATWTSVQEEAIYVGCVLTVTLVSFGLGFLFRQPVSLQWYVAADVLRRRSYQRIAVGTIAGVLIIALFLVGSGLGQIAWVAIIPVIVIGIALIRTFKRPVGPGIITRRDGLFVIGGMKKPFMRRVHQMIDAYNNRDASASAGH